MGHTQERGQRARGAGGLGWEQRPGMHREKGRRDEGKERQVASSAALAEADGSGRYSVLVTSCLPTKLQCSPGHLWAGGWSSSCPVSFRGCSGWCWMGDWSQRPPPHESVLCPQRWAHPPAGAHPLVQPIRPVVTLAFHLPTSVPRRLRGAQAETQSPCQLHPILPGLPGLGEDKLLRAGVTPKGSAPPRTSTHSQLINLI